ncbi:hypothetical protein EUGRSUZ_C01116 [Eucalyptus grandis]|uniref:Uncharacterized protein n=3 Tax=Eucalyptus TaxID=3932 RepID=A0A059CNE3_EUCGR|nr:hypothetical protein EUGRSUZ_C01116 [Eucalyptus grandis]
MHRLSSGSRDSDEFLVNLLPASAALSALRNSSANDLPLFRQPSSDLTKKESGAHLRSPGEKAIHLIPVVLFLCALTLWLCSH